MHEGVDGRLRRGGRTAARRGIAVTATLLGAMLGLAACSGGGSGESEAGGGANEEAAQIKVGWALTDSAPLILGVERGIFEQHGLDVELVESSPADLVGGLVSGQFDINPNTGSGLVLAVDKGVPLVAIAGATTFNRGVEGSSGSVFLVAEDSDIESPKDLAGEKVAVNQLSSASEFGVLTVLEDDGGDRSTVDIVEIPFPSMGDAISNGDVAGAEVAEPFAAQLLATGRYKAPFGDPIETAFGDSPRIVFATTAEWAEQNPDLVTAFRTALAESNTLATDDPDALHDIFVEYFKTTPEAAEQQMLNELNPTAELSPEGFDRINDILVEFGAIDERVPADQLIR